MQLQPYERHMACLLSGLLIGLSLVVLCDHRPFHAPNCEEISVHVVGAVDETHIHVKQGSTLEDLLQRVHLHSDADLSELDGVGRLGDGDVFVIPHMDQMTVYVTGAVEEEKVVTVPKDSGPKSILQFVQTRNDADRTSFLRRKRVKNGEVIKIKTKRRTESR